MSERWGQMSIGIIDEAVEKGIPLKTARCKASITRFPADVTVKAAWLKTLGIKCSTECVPKSARVCSFHFEDAAFEIKPSGRLFLKKGTLPIYYNEWYIPRKSNALTSGLKDFRKKKSSTDSTETGPDTDFEEIVKNSSPPLKRRKIDSETPDLEIDQMVTNEPVYWKVIGSPSSGTMTASETELIKKLISGERTGQSPVIGRKKK